MTITFDQLLETITGEREPEAGFEKIQGNTHAIFGAMYLWQWDADMTNARIQELLNLDGTDPELTTVKVHINGLSKADLIALEAHGRLAEKQLSVTGITWDKAYLRTKFGL